MTIQAPLSRSLAMICQVTRFVAIAWLLWSLVRITVMWSDSADVVRGYGRLAGHPLEPISATQHGLSYAFVLVAWVAAAAIVWRAWQLFGHYLRGDIFTAESVASLSALGWTALASIAVDLAVRPAIFMIVSGGGLKAWAEPQDLLHIMMALFILILGQVFATGVAIADDNRQII